ncbi:hypothetical protein LWC34_15835 [Kibdelosporangium philippinense]|uniref:Secreted protein n=1 Tax=Kibdelosporangium philippinense TaxID=211113 RepID=A0ABS8Z902_9PSEU|nr:hypothetical protein [Kibdelosporangium philippinense]MCE7004295.1 hypothetical protein [Kibdelosporangium philippinense]
MTAVLLAVGGVLAVAPAALAHDNIGSINNCNGRCGYGGVTNNHTRVYACDTKSDGYGFRTTYQLRNGVKGYVDDANGSSSGCSEVFPGTASNPVTYFWVTWKRTELPVTAGPFEA